jgi:SWI/SNF-related matrix-associated actin-dependent regulator of chromatin subfamily D
MQFKLDPRLARLLGIHTQTRPVIINALWQYIKTHKLQDPYEREYINCDKYLEQVSLCVQQMFACTCSPSEVEAGQHETSCVLVVTYV